MKVKSVEIAQKLGVSKATVSLALNGKPGVNADTRDAILRCKAELEQQLAAGQATSTSEAPASKAPDILEMIVFVRGLSIICDAALNLWPDACRRFDQEARNYGYTLRMIYAGSEPESIHTVIAECNQPATAGVILFATEMQPEDFALFAGIRKPMVVYDNDLTDHCHCIVADNEDITRRAVHQMVTQEYRNILYLAQDIRIYNFEQRRLGFLSGVILDQLDSGTCTILKTGKTIHDVEAFMAAWLDSHPLPDAFIMENYRVSIGLTHVLSERGIKVPEQVGLLGIDEVPSYMTADMHLTCIHLDHKNRTSVALRLLIDDIQGKSGPTKLKVTSRGSIFPGSTL